MAPWPCLIFTIWSMDPWIHSMGVVYSIRDMPPFVPSGGCGFVLLSAQNFHQFVFVLIFVLIIVFYLVVAVASILGLGILPTIKKLPLTYCNIAAQQRTRLILSCLMAWGLHRRGKTAQ